MGVKRLARRRTTMRLDMTSYSYTKLSRSYQVCILPKFKRISRHISIQCNILSRMYRKYSPTSALVNYYPGGFGDIFDKNPGLVLHYSVLLLLRFSAQLTGGSYYSTSWYMYSVLEKVPQYRYPLYRSTGIGFKKIFFEYRFYYTQEKLFLKHTTRTGPAAAFSCTTNMGKLLQHKLIRVQCTKKNYPSTSIPRTTGPVFGLKKFFYYGGTLRIIN
jgi:hypothetical protein